jgi:hypothetical protein
VEPVGPRLQKVSGADCRKIDLGPLPGTGDGMTATGFYIERTTHPASHMPSQFNTP